LPVSLKRLDERGLLKRYNITFTKGRVKHVTALEDENDRGRTTHIQLTAEGNSLAQALATGDPGAHEEATRKLQLEERREGIYFARAIMDRERWRERVKFQPDLSDLLDRAEKLVADQAGDDLLKKIKLSSAALAIAFEELEKELKGEHETIR
jgi:DNA-binding MarR family transcriptional regulator